MKKFIGFLLLVTLLSCTKQPAVKFELPSVISSGMVLQRNADINLWGKADAGKKIEVATSWGVRKSVKTDKKGKWMVSLPTGEAGGPYELAFQTDDTSVIISDILIGEVWICSGQSNMEMPVSGWLPNDTINNSAREIAKADYSMIRLFTVPKYTATQPLDSCGGTWKVCSPFTVADFSATAYFFGREIYQKLGIPIGLIHTSWGGTPAEAWTAEKYLSEFPSYKNVIDSFVYTQVEMDSLMVWMNRLKKTDIDYKDKTFFGSLIFSDESMLEADFNDSDWLSMPVPSKWESNELPNFDGVVVLRTTFEVPPSFIGKESTLHLGPIDDMDAAYINGQEIGKTLELGQWTAERNYTVPAGILREEDNVLSVRVIDNTGGGGIYSSEDILLTNKAGVPVILSGDWHYLPVAEIIGNTMYFYDKENSYKFRPAIAISIGQNTPTTLYNAMINPLVPYTIKGAIWYQGETNVGRGFEYRSLFPAMIANWREVWGQGDFPFYYVQIAPWEYGDDVPSSAAELREAQLMTLSVPHTGMAVITDIGNPVNIHPSNKQEVGRRLALWALAKDYGYDSIIFSGPLYDTITVEKGKIMVHFTHTDGGLISDGQALSYFEIAGEDQQYYPALAAIVGNTVEVYSDQVVDPVAVRFGWRATAEPNLFNGAGLPASPFRSDNWKRLSE